MLPNLYQFIFNILWNYTEIFCCIGALMNTDRYLIQWLWCRRPLQEGGQKTIWVAGCFFDPSPGGGDGASTIGSDTGQGLFATCLYVRTHTTVWLISEQIKIKSISKSLLT